MTRASVVPCALALSLCAACGTRSEPPPPSTAEAAAAAKPTPDTTDTTPPDPNEPTQGAPAAPSMDGAGAVPSVTVLAEPACAELTPLAEQAPESQRELVPIVEVLRALSCQPALFGLSTPTVRETVPVPATIPLQLGRRYARVGLVQPIAVRDLLAVMGVEDAKLRLEQGWSSRWALGVGKDAAALSPWGPGVVSIWLPGERNDERANGTLADVPPDATIADWVTVVMPDTALGFAPDPYAAPAVVGALLELAKDPTWLDKEPEQAHAGLTTLGERYELHRYSVGLGDEQRVGFSLRTRRTELDAALLAEGLGLEGARHEHISITDTNPNRLWHADQTEITWRGLELEIELAEGGNGKLGLAGWIVTDIQILPAEDQKTE